MNHKETILNLLKDIQESIDYLERYPGMWGSFESQEITMLNLVETRSALLRPESRKNNPFEVRNAWADFICSINGEWTSFPLYIVLKNEGRLDLLPSLLGDFARWVMVKYPPEVQYNDS